jgi:hypothetical protein
MARGTPGALALGPGYLYISDDLSCTEPTDLSTAWASVDADWKAIGYTKEGSEFKYSLATDTVEVAEELDPISNQTTGRTSSLTFAMAEVTATHLLWAMNASSSALTAGSGITTFEPPDIGSEVRRKLGWESEDGEERWVFRQCFQTGDTTITRAKGSANATIAVEFSLEKPATGSKLFKAVMKTPDRA